MNLFFRTNSRKTNQKNYFNYRRRADQSRCNYFIGGLLICLCLTGSLWAQETAVTNIKFTSGKNTLHGQISIPKNKKNLPLIIFLPGSGDTSYQTGYQEFVSQTVEEIFKKDFAILYFDKPGVNESTGEWWNQDFYAQAENSISALEYALENFPIDKSRVGIIGHSQGGWLTQLIAAKYPEKVRFGVSLAGPAVSVLEQMTETENSRFLCEGFDSRTAKEKAAQSARAIENSNLDWLLSKDYGLTDKDLSSIRIIKNYNPRPEIKKIKVPFLFVYGENDEFVYATESLKSLKQIFAGEIPKNIATVVIPRADHMFQVKEKCFKGDAKTLRLSEVLNSQMKRWVKQVLKA